MTGLRSVIVKFAIFAIVSVLLLWILLNTMLNGVSGDKNHFDATFTDVSGLRVGDDVKVAGVRVGRVTSIELHKTSSAEDTKKCPGATYCGADVKIEVEKGEQVPTNAQLAIRYQNLVGQRYLSLRFLDAQGNQVAPASTYMSDNSRFASTDPGFDLTSLLNGFRPLFQVLRPQDVNTLSNTIIQVLQGEGPTIDSLLKQTAQLTNYVANRDQVIGSVLTNLTPVLQDFAAHDADMRTTVVALRDMFTGLANDRMAIGNAIDGLSKLVVTTNGILTEVKTPLEGTVHELHLAADMLAASRTNLVNGINGFNTAISGLGRTGSYENALNIYVCTLGISLNGAAPINPGSPANNSAVCK